MKKYCKKVLLISMYFFVVLLIMDNFTINFINLIVFTIILILGSEFIKNKIVKN